MRKLAVMHFEGAESAVNGATSNNFCNLFFSTQIFYLYDASAFPGFLVRVEHNDKNIIYNIILVL